MSIERFRGDPPKQSAADAAASLVQIWQAMAETASDIAAARRSIYLAYVAEGFTDAQALELVKTI